MNKQKDNLYYQHSFLENSDNTKHIVNVASVPQRSPFRYPGGKTWLVPKIRVWLSTKIVKPSLFIEPFAGGGIISLTVAAEHLAKQVIMVELDELVSGVWETIIEDHGGGGMACK
jgi:DNA adenine methylase